MKKNYKTTKVSEPNERFTGDVIQVPLDANQSEKMHNLISQGLIWLFFNFDTNEERTVAVKDFVNAFAEDGFLYEDDEEKVKGIKDMILDTIDYFGLKRIIQSAAYHAFFNTADEDYIGTFFSVAVTEGNPDEHLTVIVNDMVDFWIVSNGENIWIIPVKSEKINNMTRKFFEDGEHKDSNYKSRAQHIA